MIYVDDPFTLKLYRRDWCHMMTDGPSSELHEFAQRIGVKRCWFQRDHYDLSPRKRALAIQHGARPVERKFMVQLRQAKRKPPTDSTSGEPK